MKKIILLTLLSLLSACGSTPPRSVPAPTHAPVKNETAMNDLLMYALSLADTPYRYGGNTPEQGFDCSGFVDHVFRHSLNIQLPRTSAELSKSGQIVPLKQLQAGDLVFYNTQHRPYSHVGIFIGDGKFVHAPKTGSQIRVENMNNGYWLNRYNGGRRIPLPD